MNYSHRSRPIHHPPNHLNHSVANAGKGVGNFKLGQVLRVQPSREVGSSIEQCIEGEREADVGEEIETDKFEQLQEASLKDNLKLSSAL